MTKEGTFFAKNSDRPVNEAQVVRSYPPRQRGSSLKTQYLQIPDDGAFGVVLSQPEWLWGAEHGINENKVAIGNEKIYTIDDPYLFQNALIGMDLVRLGLERAKSAKDAVEIIVDLLETFGQGGIGDITTNEPYWSSFLISDPFESYVLETSAKTWAAKRVEKYYAISNRVSLKDDWDFASKNLLPSKSFDDYRNKDAPVEHANVRLESNTEFLTSLLNKETVTIYDFITQLRSHGESQSPPKIQNPFGQGITVCMHIAGFQLTQASMACFLPNDPKKHSLAFFALGNPCSSIFLPAIPPVLVPKILSEISTWKYFCEVARLAESSDSAYNEITSQLRKIEDSLIEQAITIWGNLDKFDEFISYIDNLIASYITEMAEKIHIALK